MQNRIHLLFKTIALLLFVVLTTSFRKSTDFLNIYQLYSQSDKFFNSLAIDSVIQVGELGKLDSNNVSVINLKTAEKILYTGSSSVGSYYAPDRKSWVNKLADFLDIILVPYGFSGDGADSLAHRLAEDVPAQIAAGVKPSEINATYVFCGQTLNSRTLLNQEFDSAFIASNENLIRTAVTRLGAKPIIGTAYRTEFRIWIENSLKQLADKWNADFIPFGSYHKSLIRNDKYKGFYGNAHPSIRTHDSYTLPLMRYFMQMERPKQTILLFDARDSKKDISTLVYKDNFQRAERFRSIQVGEMALDSEYQEMYDRLDEKGYTWRKKNTSDYMKLLNKQTISLKDKSLIEVIIPKVRPDRIVFNLLQTGVMKAYLFDNFSNTWKQVAIEDGRIIFSELKYIEFDKIKLLLVGSMVRLSDISVSVIGGVDKPRQNLNRIMPPNAGEKIIKSEGFDERSAINWNMGYNKTYNQTEKYGTDFADIPQYLGSKKDVLVLSEPLTRVFALQGVGSFGYRTLRVWTCARLNPKIYNPDRYLSWQGVNNPFTNVSWYDEDKYDYDDLQVIIKYHGEEFENMAKSRNVQKVGLFWDLGYIDVLLPIVSDGSYELQISRSSWNNNYDMELCDVEIELLPVL